MDQSTLRADLFTPGEAGNFFAIEDLPQFDPHRTTAFSRRNALWLAEFSRLIYRQEADEIGAAAKAETRQDILAKAGGWRETDLIRKGGTQAAFFVHEELGCACLVFRGTLGFADLLTDFNVPAVEWRGPGHIHFGFAQALDVVWRPIEARLRSLPHPVFFTGHSLGGALATLAAARVLLDPQFARPAAVYTFGSPRVGDEAFGRALKALFHCRLVNDHDLVTTVPPAVSLPLFPVYQHTGEMHRLLPDGTMELYPAGFDVRTTRSPATGIIDLTRNVSRLIKQSSLGGAIPQSLMDHAPVNYTARLEKTAATES